MKKLLIILISVVILSLTGVFAGAIIYSNSHSAAVAPPPPTYPTPPEIISIYQRLGISADDISHIRINLDSGVGACSMPRIAACFDGAIEYPRPLLSNPIIEQNATLAHEYMHWVWVNKLSADDKEWLTTDLNNLYAHNSGLYQRLADYRQLPPDKITNELHSYACTEMLDSELPSRLLAHCSRYVPNRNALPNHF